jgi:hypothetical protein
VEALVDLERGGVFCIGPHGDRRAVRIGAGDHQHLSPAQALVARKNIGRQVRAGQVPDMDFSIGIRPGNGDQNSPLTAYQEQLGDDVFSAARAINTASISQEDTLNPQVLLAILHGEGQPFPD